MEYSNLFVCLMGMGTVFLGLVCLVFLVKVMCAVVNSGEKKQAVVATPAPAPVAAPAPMNNGKKEELMAAIAAAIAEDMGTDISAVRIVSIKKV